MGFLCLEEAAQHERNNLPPFVNKACFVQPTSTDPIAEGYLKDTNLLHLGTAFKVTANGSCLFNSVSVALCGSEEISTELRVRTCIEMVINKARYISHPKASDLIWVSPNYVSSTIDCANPRGWSSIWTILALSQVIGRPIQSVYPPINGIQDLSYKFLNFTAVPRNCTDESAVKSVLWTRSSTHNPDRIWISDHFTPIITAAMQQSNVPSILDIDEFPPLPTLCSSPAQHDTSLPVHSVSMEQTDEFPPVPVSPTTDDTSLTVTESGMEQTEVTPVQLPNANSLLNGKNLTAAELFTCVQDHVVVVQDIPKGFKDNVYFCLQKQTNGASFPDDCGSWDTHSGRTVKTDFVLTADNCLKFTIKKDNMYYFEKKSKGKKKLTLYDPQPERVVTLHRYYTVLKRDKTYKKRVSWFSNIPPEFKNVAVVEYTGTCPRTNLPHGNSKHSTQEYIRTDPKILDKVKEGIQQKQSCSDIYKEMVLQDPESAPRDYHQIRNMKYNQKKRVSPATNVADEIIEMLDLVHKDDFVKEVVYSKDNNKPPALICYTSEQLLDMQNFLKIDSERIIGIDRTFNLGSVYVTNMVYKNKKVISKETGDHPIFIGPLFLHWEGSFLSYHTFLSHVKARLQDNINTIDLRIGSDDEKGLTKAIDSVFPEATRLLCTKHMKDNVADYLKNNIGSTDTERSDIIAKLFGQGGLATADDSVDFDEKAKDIVAAHPKFTNYFESRLKERLQNHVNKPRAELDQHRLWTNNNCESINHVLSGH